MPWTLSFGDFLKRDGFWRLWRGAPAVVLGSIPSHAAYFSAYEAGKEALGANRPGHHPVEAAATGALATTVHDGVATPMDVVKQRLQLGYYRGVVHCVRTMAAEEGLLSLWRSYPTTLIMNMPYAAAVVSANESFKKLLVPVTGPLSLSTYLLSGAGAGAIAAAATCPLDVVKTRLQTQGMLSDGLGGGGFGGGGGSGGGGGGGYDDGDFEQVLSHPPALPPSDNAADTLTQPHSPPAPLALAPPPSLPRAREVLSSLYFHFLTPPTSAPRGPRRPLPRRPRAALQPPP